MKFFQSVDVVTPPQPRHGLHSRLVIVAGFFRPAKPHLLDDQTLLSMLAGVPHGLDSPSKAAFPSIT